MDDRELRQLLLHEACEPYRAAGRFAYHFARGKLGGDPAFVALLREGWLGGCIRVLDLGCGQGVLFSWLLAARRCHARGQWPAHWAAPPECAEMTGIELLPPETRRARTALGGAASIVQADLRVAPLPPADAVVVLDVLHYLDRHAQVELLRRIRAALAPGGVLLVRIGDADGGLGFAISWIVDRLVLASKGSPVARLACRSAREWQALLGATGFECEAVPMSQGTPFANVLLRARAA